MNILILVMSMLMIFSLMTYAKLENYRSTAGIEGEFTRYMEVVERSYINMSADKMYKKVTFGNAAPTPPPKKEETPPNEPKRKGKSSGRLSFYPFVNPVMREEDNKEYKKTVTILKQLIQTLYGEQPHFADLFEKHPTIIDQLIERLPQAIESLPETIKIRKAPDLSNLELGGHLDELFYLMLKGCPSLQSNVELKQTSEKAEERADDRQEAEEFSSDKSYDSLLNFIDLHHSLKINVYLASKPLLIALYGDEAIADNILRARYDLYKTVDREEMSEQEASEKFKTDFPLDGSDTLLEYRVTGSDPRRYN